VRALLDQYRTLLASACAAPQTAVDVLELLGNEWRQRVLGDFASVDGDTPSEPGVHELIAQIAVVSTEAGVPILNAGNVVEFHLDDDIVWSGGQITDNRSRLLVHPPGLWEQRPPVDPGLGRLFLAGDYVRNDTDLATMEGANQSARDAVNALLDADASNQPRARSDVHLDDAEPDWLKEFKERDQEEFDAGRPPLAERIHSFSALAALDSQIDSEQQLLDHLARAQAALMELL